MSTAQVDMIDLKCETRKCRMSGNVILRCNLQANVRR